jgi:hypothetical protein
VLELEINAFVFKQFDKNISANSALVAGSLICRLSFAIKYFSSLLLIFALVLGTHVNLHECPSYYVFYSIGIPCNWIAAEFNCSTST